MAKQLSLAVVVEADLKAYLETQDDFALELFVFNEAANAGLQPAHGGSYVDPTTGKDRQFDIRASKVWRHRRVSLAVECKALRPHFPILISRVPRTERESNHCYVNSYRRDGVAGDARGESAPAHCESICPSAVYLVGAPVGKSIQQVGRDSKGDLTTSSTEVFEKWSQAFASSADLVAETWLSANRELANYRFVSAVLPVLVVSNHTLWVADYGPDGRLQSPPHQVGEASCFFGKEYPGPGNLVYRISHLHVLTKSAVPAFFGKFADDQPHWHDVFPPDKFPNDGAMAHRT